MRTLIAALGAFALIVPAAAPLTPAQAQTRSTQAKQKHRHHYVKRCRKSKGTAGLIAGGVVGVIAGPAIIGHGLLGAAIGGAGGALGGRAIDRSLTAKNRCHYERR